MASPFDPRPDIEPSIRPIVEPPRRILPAWLIVTAAILLGTMLFLELNARRVARSAPAAKAPAAMQAEAAQQFPPLYLPPVMLAAEPAPAQASLMPPVTAATPMAERPQRLASAAPPGIEAQPPEMAQPALLPSVRSGSPVADEQVLVFDGTVGDSQGAQGPSQTSATSGGSASLAPSTTGAVVAVAARARSGTLLNRATIVPQGTLIPAVLETALDSTRPGGARALVTRDVAGFDGARILIPRGSRLYGEYRADLSPGQGRALVIWTRLVRPDGVSVALDSPAADPLGRNGVKGKVNSHFLERFSSALLQTALDVGGNIAVREISRGSVTVLALPGSSPGSGSGSGSSLTGDSRVQRTLKVRQGVSVSVFVSRDLDFTAVDAR